MDTIVAYEQSGVMASTIALPTTLTTSEADLGIYSYGGGIKQSQLSIYVGLTLGGVAKGTFNYYYSPNYGDSANATVWYPVSLYNTSTGEITQRSVVVDSGTYATGGVSRYVDNVPLGGCVAFKVTGIAASGTPTLNALTVMVRNN